MISLSVLVQYFTSYFWDKPCPVLHRVATYKAGIGGASFRSQDSGTSIADAGLVRQKLTARIRLELALPKDESHYQFMNMRNSWAERSSSARA